MALIDNLISYYKLEANWNDSFGSNNCTESNTSYVTGKIWNAASFNGSNSQMRNGVITLPAWNSPYSINFWVKLNAEITTSSWWFAMLWPDGTNQDTIYSISYQYNWWTRRLIMEHYYNWPETYWPISGNTTLGTSNWNMVTITYSGSTMKIYLNAIEIASGWWTGTYGSNAWPTYQKWFTIGSLYYNSTYNNIANAIFDEVGVWWKTFTSWEVTQIYNGGSWLQYPFSLNNWAGFSLFF